MPFAKGSMRNLLEENKFKNHKFAYCFFERLGSVLKYLHEQCINEDKKGVIHRDLKPENVLIDDNDMPLLADLGIAHINPKFMIVPVKTRSDERLLRRQGVSEGSLAPSFGCSFPFFLWEILGFTGPSSLDSLESACPFDNFGCHSGGSHSGRTLSLCNNSGTILKFYG